MKKCRSNGTIVREMRPLIGIIQNFALHPWIIKQGASARTV